MKLSRHAGRPHLLLTLIALVSAVLVPTLTASPASAANPDRCSTQVWSLQSSGSTVSARYRVWCSVTQKRIIVTARMYDQTTNRYSTTKNKECFDNFACEVSLSMSNKAGIQTYRAEGVDCLPGYPSCALLAVSKNGSTTESTEMLPCAAPCLGGMVIRRSDF